MFVLSSRACISFGPKNRSIGAAAKSQVGRVSFFPKMSYFSDLSLPPFSNYLCAHYVSSTGRQCMHVRQTYPYLHVLE